MLSKIKTRIVRDGVADRELLQDFISKSRYNIYITDKYSNSSDLIDTILSVLKNNDLDDMLIEIFDVKDNGKQNFVLVMGEEGYQTSEPMQVAIWEGAYCDIYEQTGSRDFKVSDFERLLG